MFAHFKFRSGERLRIGAQEFICTSPSGILNPQPEFAIASSISSLAWLGDPVAEVMVASDPVIVETAEPESDPVVVDIVDLEDPQVETDEEPEYADY